MQSRQEPLDSVISILARFDRTPPEALPSYSRLECFQSKQSTLTFPWLHILAPQMHEDEEASQR